MLAEAKAEDRTVTSVTLRILRREYPETSVLLRILLPVDGKMSAPIGTYISGIRQSSRQLGPIISSREPGCTDHKRPRHGG